MRAILFDLDGTLADSFHLIVGTMQRVFERAGLPVPGAREVQGIIGLSLATAIHRLTPTTPERELEALVDLYRTTFHEVRNDPAMEERLFPGVEDMLRTLSRRGAPLGIVTGKSRRGVRIVTEKYGLAELFQVVRTADDCPSKPDPAMVLECCADLGLDPADALVVGDSIYDMEMAVAAGAGALGVCWGAGSAEALAQAGAGQIVSDVATLTDVLCRGVDAQASSSLYRASIRA